MVKVIIMRGVSGSGKSTYARKMYPGALMFSSDDYWTCINPNKTYQENFDVTKLGEAHTWNMRRFIDYMLHLEKLWNHSGTVIIDNTNTTLAEIAPYYAVAQAFGADVQVVTLDVLQSVAFKRNTHGVPEKAHMAQHLRLLATNVDFPPYWKHTIIKGV